MEVMYPRCAGLDVHAGTVVACVRIATGAAVTYEHRTVTTTSRGLLELADWLAAHGCTHVAMEATRPCNCVGIPGFATCDVTAVSSAAAWPREENRCAGR